MYRSPFRSKPHTVGSAFMQTGTMWASGHHTGEDWFCDTDTTLVAPATGVIARNQWDKSYGNYIIIATKDGKSILMAHMVAKALVAEGASVQAGQVVGNVGSTGNSTGPHLHVEVESTPIWTYNSNLLRPSDQIDFNNFSIESGEFELARVYQNGSTIETVYADTALTIKIGSLNPHEACDCLGIVNERRIVKYAVSGTNTFKVGLVAYHGGIE